MSKTRTFYVTLRRVWLERPGRWSVRFGTGHDRPTDAEIGDPLLVAAFEVEAATLDEARGVAAEWLCTGRPRVMRVKALKDVGDTLYDLVKRRSASELFDMARFRADVAAHMTRWRMTARDLANECGCTDNAIMPWLRGDRDAVGLLVVCALADVVDLSLDKYRRPVR